MPDEDDDKPLTPQESKCWTCRHGMTLHEHDLQTFVQPGMIQSNPFESGEAERPGFTEMAIDVKKVRSVCFWRAQAGQQIVSPLIFNVVTECNRYEQRKD